MFVPLLLTLHVWQPPPLRAPLEAPALASALPVPELFDALLAQAPPQLSDPYVGSISAEEVVGGAVGSLGGSVAAAVLSLGFGLTSCAVTGTGGEVPGCVIGALFVWMLGQLALPPLFAAGGANALSNPPIAGSFGRAVGYAYAAQGLGLVASVVVGFGAEAELKNGGAGFLIAFAIVELLVLPNAASYGLHDGPPVSIPAVPSVAPPPAAPPQDAPPPLYTPPAAPPPPVSLPPPPPVVGFAFPF